jgi:type VI secretion system protein VasJ
MLYPNPEIINLGTEPISDAAPAGESVRYDPEFEQLAAEIAKLESITPTAIDWSLVVQLSETILKTKSKDYRVASYLVLALFQTDKFQGLLNGFKMYEELIRNFWETGFPEITRIRGRIGSLEWLSGRLGTALARDAKSSAPDDLILELEKTTQSLPAALAELLGDKTPSFKDFQTAVESRAKEVRARTAAAERAKEEKARRAEAIASGDVTEVADAEKVIDECREKLIRISGFLFKAEPTAPTAYRISRSITWGWLVSVPTNENGVTFIPPVPADAIQKCNALAESKNWNAIVDEVESEFFNRVFGFGLQRLCVQALKELGEGYAGPRQAILTELAALAKRLPEIFDLKFNDGSQFADPQTKSWIKSEVLPIAISSGTPEPAGDTKTDPESSAPLEAAAKAKRLLAEGKLQEAMGLFTEGIAKSSLCKVRFLWRLQLAKLCMEAGKLQLALPQLTALDEDVSRFCLEEWEPGLSLEVIQQLYLCRQKLAGSMQERPPDLENQLAQLYQRLCKLDVNAALAVES